MSAPTAAPTLGSWNRPLPLNEVFSDLKPEVRVPRSEGAVFKAALNNWIRQHRVWVLGWVIGIGTGLGIGLGTSLPLVSIGVPGVLIAAAIGLLFIISSRADNVYWSSYASGRGLSESNGIGITTPIGRTGIRQGFDVAYSVTLGGNSAILGHYTYVTESTTTDSEGHTRREEHDHHFTLVVFQLPQAVGNRYRGVYCHKKKLSLGKFQDWISSDRAVKLESVDFGNRYSLRASDTQDDVALFELFSTTFVDALSTNLSVQWEQEAYMLVVFQPKHLNNTAKLDELCASALRVQMRYCEEYM